MLTSRQAKSLFSVSVPRRRSAAEGLGGGAHAAPQGHPGGGGTSPLLLGRKTSNHAQRSMSRPEICVSHGGAPAASSISMSSIQPSQQPALIEAHGRQEMALLLSSRCLNGESLFSCPFSKQARGGRSEAWGLGVHLGAGRVPVTAGPGRHPRPQGSGSLLSSESHETRVLAPQDCPEGSVVRRPHTW